MKRLLDLYCRVGGASEGYKRAGFTVYGVDIEPIDDYPFPHFWGDALTVIDILLAGGGITFSNGETLYLTDFDAIHASPPCQVETALSKGTNKRLLETYPNLIPPTRDRLELTSVPWVIENVQGSKVRRDLTLCGEFFGLEVLRHRYFELGGWSMAKPAHHKHRGRVAGYRHGEWFTGPYFAVYGDGGGKGTVAEWQRAMGIDWTANRKNIAEAIPPAYAEFIGGGLMTHLERIAA
jgi:hypothetical protein